MKMNCYSLNKIHFTLLPVALIIFLMFSADALAAGPRETLEENLNQVLEVLNKSPEESDIKSKIEKITSISEKIFDYREISGRSLGVHWKKLDPDEKKRFADLYQELLKKTYADRIQSYSGEKVTYEKTLNYGSDRAQVYTLVLTKDGRVPVNYRMKKENDRWQVYDVVIEGVSLVNNYRSQFKEILANKSIEELFQLLERKVKD